MTNRRVLITGAGGFVGGALVSGFVDLGWDVIAVDRDFDELSEPDGVQRIVVDLGDSPADLPASDVVIHAAWVTADPRELGISESDYVELNLRPLATMIEHANDHRTDVFVFVSSSGVFAATDAEGGLDDRSIPTGSSAYAKAKLMGERLVQTELSAETAVRVVRLGYLYGFGESARESRPGVSLVAQWLAAANEGEPLRVRADDPLREWTFAGDLAPVIARLADDPAIQSNPIHLGSPHVVSDTTLAAIIAARAPGLAVASVPAGRPVKPPMIASDLPAIRDFDWTEPSEGLSAMLGAGAAT